MRKLLLIVWRMSRADLRLLWFALKHADRPAWLLPTTILLGLYAIAPFNLTIPAFGVIDDMVLVPFALHYLLKCLPPRLLRTYAPHGAG